MAAVVLVTVLMAVVDDGKGDPAGLFVVAEGGGGTLGLLICRVLVVVQGVLTEECA